MSTSRSGLGAGWRHQIRTRWGISVAGALTVAVDFALWVTRCSKAKGDVLCGTPEELYVSPVNRYFYARMGEYGVRFGVLSDKYGLHLDRQELPAYDVHPRTLSDADKRRLGQLIRAVALGEGFSRIVFYSPSPLMSVPYFEMLSYSGLAVQYTTRLPALPSDALQGGVQSRAMRSAHGGALSLDVR